MSDGTIPVPVELAQDLLALCAGTESRRKLEALLVERAWPPDELVERFADIPCVSPNTAWRWLRAMRDAGIDVTLRGGDDRG